MRLHSIQPRAVLLCTLIVLAAAVLAACGGNKTSSLAVAPPDYLRQLDTAQTPQGVDPAVWEQLKTALRNAIESAGTEKATAGVPTQPKNKVDDFRIRFQYSNSQADCFWNYRNVGDYDLNGEVNISDLTPIGVNFKKKTLSPDWETARMADGDGNGEVNIADVTPIGANLAHQIVGYMLQRTKTPEVEDSWHDVDPIPLSAALASSTAPMGKYFCYDLPGGVFANSYRIVPYAGTGATQEFGIPSNVDALPAFDSGTRGQDFLVELNQFTDTLPAFDSQGNAYAGSKNNYLYSVDPAGAQRWQYLTNGDLKRPAVGPDDTVYAGCEDGTLYAVNPDGTLRWTFLAESGMSAPAVGADGRIYVGSADRRMYCLNDDGSLAWSFDAGLPVYGAPAFAQDGTVYFDTNSQIYIGKSKLVALHPDGSLYWRFDLPNNFVYYDEFESPQVAPDGDVLTDPGGVLYSLNPADGSVQWTYTDLPLQGRPEVGPDGTIYIGAQIPGQDIADTDGLLIALNPDGGEKWRYDQFTDHYSNVDAFLIRHPIVGPSGVYLLTDEGEFIALGFDGSLTTSQDTGHYGELLWGPDNHIYLDGPPMVKLDTDGTTIWKFGDPPGTDGVLFGNGQVYASTTKLSAFDPAGTKLWDYSDGFDISQTEIAMGADGLVYGIDQYGVVAAVKPDGTTQWHGGPLPWIPYQAPAISGDGSVYVTFGLNYGNTSGYKERLTAFDSTGNEKWHKEFDFYAGRTPAIDADGNIYMGGSQSGLNGDYDSHLVALRPNGTEIWEYDTPLYTGYWNDSPCLFGDNKIYLQGNDYGLDSGALVQLDLDGFELGLTKAPVGLYLGMSFRPDGTILSGGYVGYCASDSVITTFNPDGSLVWASNIKTASVTTPVAGPDGSVYVGGGDGNLYALNADGSSKWVYHARDGFNQKPAVGPDGTVYALDDAGVLYSIAP